jgi:archaellum component FlaC
MSDEEMTKNARALERHAQTIIVVVIVGLLGWVATTVQQTQVAIAKLTVEIEYLKVEASKPNGKFESIEARLNAIEQQLAMLAERP